jgi:hypothetical protein
MRNTIIKSLFICTIFFLSKSSNLHAQWQWLNPGYTNAGSYAQSNWGVAVDPSGCVYTTGVYTNQSNSEIQIPFRKFAPDGKLLFAKLYNTGFGNDNLEQGNDIGVSLANNTIVIGGQQHGGKPFLGFFRADNGNAIIAPIAFSGSGFIQKIDIKGNEVWAIGRFDNNLTLGSGAPTLVGNSSYYGNVFVARYNLVTGAFISAFYLQSPYIWGYDIKVEASNRVFITARTAGVVTFKNSSNQPTGSTYTQPAANLYDAFLAKVNANGTTSWVKSLSNSHSDLYAYDQYPISYVSVQADFVVVGGYSNQTKTSSFLQKRLSTTGALQSQVANIPGKGINDIEYSFCSKKLYVVGATNSSPTSCTSQLFLDKYDFGGNLAFLSGQTSNACAVGSAIAIDGAGMPIVTGNYSGGPFTINNQTVSSTSPKGVVTGLFYESSLCCSNRGLILDGSDDYLKPSTLPLSGSSNFTFEAWINSTSSGVFGGSCNAAFRRLLGWGLAGGNQVEIGDCNGLLAVQYTGLNGSGAFWPTGVSVRNVWNHVALVKNGNNFTLYINGAFAFSSPTTSITIPANSVFYIGRPVSTPNGSENWKGLVDEVRFWNVARTAAQVSGKKDCRLKGNEPGLLLYYPFEQGSPGNANANVNIAYNYATVGQYATLYNFALTGELSNWICASQVGLTMNGICTPFAPEPDEEDRSEEYAQVEDFNDGASLKLKIFPNPNTGLFNVQLSDDATPNMALRVLDLTGRVLIEKQTETDMALQSIEAVDLPDGLYFLQIVSDGKVLAVEKFVKQ